MTAPRFGSRVVAKLICTPSRRVLVYVSIATLSSRTATIVPRPTSPRPESRCVFSRARMPFGTDDGNVTRACENRTPAQIRTCSLPNLVATGAALALLLENTGVRPFGLAVERGRRVDDGSKTTRARWVGRRRAADFVASRAVGPSRHGHAEAAPLRCAAAQKREQYYGRDRRQCTLGHCSLSLFFS